MQFTSETIQDTIATANALKAATEVQKEQMKKLDMNKLEDVYDDLADLMAEQEEINDVLGRDFQVGNYDEEELMDGSQEIGTATHISLLLLSCRTKRVRRRDSCRGVERGAVNAKQEGRRGESEERGGRDEADDAVLMDQ